MKKIILFGLAILTSVSAFSIDKSVEETNTIQITGVQNLYYNARTGKTGVAPFEEDRSNYLMGIEGRQIAEINCVKPSWPSWNGYKSIKAWFFTGYLDVKAPVNNKKSYSFVRYQFESVEECKKIQGLIFSDSSSENPLELTLKPSIKVNLNH